MDTIKKVARKVADELRAQSLWRVRHGKRVVFVHAKLWYDARNEGARVLGAPPMDLECEPDRPQET